jgi:hypothetical protein
VEYAEGFEDASDLVRYVLFFQQIPNLSHSRTAPYIARKRIVQETSVKPIRINSRDNALHLFMLPPQNYLMVNVRYGTRAKGTPRAPANFTACGFLGILWPVLHMVSVDGKKP